MGVKGMDSSIASITVISSWRDVQLLRYFASWHVGHVTLVRGLGTRWHSAQNYRWILKDLPHKTMCAMVPIIPHPTPHTCAYISTRGEWLVSGY